MAFLTAMEIVGMTREWVGKNPKVWKWMKQTARECTAMKRHFSVARMVEEARYTKPVEGVDEYRINNDIRAALTRWLIVEIPDCEPYIEKRRSKLDAIDWRNLEWAA